MKVIHKKTATSNFKVFTRNCCQYACYVADLPSSRTWFVAVGNRLRARKVHFSQLHKHVDRKGTLFNGVNENLETEIKLITYYLNYNKPEGL